MLLENKNRPETTIFFVFALLVLVVYISFGMASYSAKSGPLTFGKQFLTEPVISDYFNNLALSFTQGRLDVSGTRDELDLIVFNGKKYLLWPPVPAIVLTPLVALFGVDLPDRLINAILGSLNAFLFLLIFRNLRTRYNFGFLTTNVILALGTFWALGTVHFYMSLSGKVWFISQIMAQTFLLAALGQMLKRDKSQASYLLAGLWFGLAVYTRNDLVFSGIFMTALIYEDCKGKLFDKAFLTRLSIFGMFFIIFSLLNLEYNYLRFGSAFENGANYHLMAERFKLKFEKWGYLSTHYIPHNVYYEVFKMPELTPSPPFIVMDFDGFGLLWVSPLFLLLFPSFFFLIKKIKSGPNIKAMTSNGSLMLAAAFISILPIAFTIFTVMGTGELQFGARYTLDFHIFLCLLLLPAIAALVRLLWFRIVCAGLIAVSCLINAIGVFLFF